MTTSITGKASYRPLATSLKAITIYFIIYLSGLGAFFLMIADPFTMKTYFSDNSLLPGLVNREFSLGTETEYYLKDIKTIVEAHGENSSSLADSPPLVNFMRHELNNFGLELHEQHFSYQSMFDSDKVLKGVNLYTIIRGERSTNSEAVVLCSPYYRYSNSNNTHASFALSLALSKYFSARNYWAKDIIILFVDQGKFGVSAWTNSYHDIKSTKVTSCKCSNPHAHINYDDLDERSGPIQAAIILEFYGKEYARANLKIQGMNGQLPNLDILNLGVEIATREQITVYINDKSLPYDLSSEQLYMHHLESVWTMVKSQATMNPDGLHGFFQKFSIQSFTIQTPEYKPSRKSKYMTASLLQAGRLLEGIFRSLNNLVERFNRSYYFYLIASIRRFTSIGYYMISVGLMIAPLLVKAWWINSDGQVYNNFLLDSGLSSPKYNIWHGIIYSIYTYTTVLILTLFSVLAILYFRPTLHHLIILLFIISNILVSGFLSRGDRSTQVAKKPSSIVLVANLNLALILSLLSVVNISTSLIITALAVPPALLADIPRSSLSRFIKHFSIIYWSIVTYYIGQQMDIYQSYEDWYLFGNWSFFILPIISLCCPIFA